MGISKYNRSEVAAYAQGHTSAEVAMQFGFPSREQAAMYMTRHTIEWVRERAAATDCDWDAIARYAPTHTAAETAAEFGLPLKVIYAFLCRRKIPYCRVKGGRKATAGDSGNAVYEWFLDHGSCQMCIDLGWERGCRKSAKDCEAFLRGKLKPFFTGAV